jgi:hypothetical protein
VRRRRSRSSAEIRVLFSVIGVGSVAAALLVACLNLARAGNGSGAAFAGTAAAVLVALIWYSARSARPR